MVGIRWLTSNRVTGELTLIAPKADAGRAEDCFKRALLVARQRQTKSWELRAAMSLAGSLARPGKGPSGGQTATSGLRLVYGGIRYARTVGGEGVY